MLTREMVEGLAAEGVRLGMDGERAVAVVYYRDEVGVVDNMEVGRFPLFTTSLDQVRELAAAIRNAHLIGMDDGRLYERQEMRDLAAAQRAIAT